MLKKTVSLIITLSMLLAAVPLFISASADSIIQNDPIFVGSKAPTIDGEIRLNEGWSDPAVMNKESLGYILNDIDPGFYAEVFFAANDDGFWFSANIMENIVGFDPDMSFGDTVNKNIFVPSTGVDDPTLYGDFEDTGWNGDTFILTLDPLGLMMEYGFTGRHDFPPRYAVTMFSDGSTRIYREMIFEGEITEQVAVAGNLTDYGWCFEACIPWEIIIKDIEDITFGEIELDRAEILTKGSRIRASAAYCDRYIDDDGNIKDLNHYITVPEVMADGTFGHTDPGYYVMSMGIELIVGITACTPIGHDWVFELYFDATYISPGFGINQCSVCGEIEYVTIPKKELTGVFDDVKSTHWYCEAVNYCLKHAYMVGVSENRFAPLNELTREQFVQILANYEGVDTDAYKYRDSGMKDVPPGRWYSGAVAWAVEEGYVSGVAPGRFGTGQSIERAALVRLLWLYTKKQGIDVSDRADLTVYADGHKVQDWMHDGLEWAVYNGLITSTSDYYMSLAPRGKVTRGMAAVLIMNYDEYIHDQTFGRN